MMSALALERCAVHTITNRPWSLAECCEAYAEAGFGGVSVWRNAIEAVGLNEAERIIRSSGLSVPALVRGGFFVSSNEHRRAAAIEENTRCIDEAAAIGASMVVLVVGAEPGLPLAEARGQVEAGIVALVPRAEACGVRLAIEPIHPMYAADRSCINRVREAREMCERIASPQVGVALDVYHTWWDADLDVEIERCGESLFGFHVCDWRTPRDLLNDREIMGRGCIDVPAIRACVERAGFTGMTEIEIFSDVHWDRDQGAYLADIVSAVLSCRA